MCRGNFQQQWGEEQKRPKVVGASSVRTPTSALEHCFRSRGVEQAWNLLEAFLQSNASSAEEGDQGLLAADKYTVSQMLSKTTSERWHKDVVYRGITLSQNFIDACPSVADEGLFNALLDACCQLKDVQRLDEVMDKMRQLQVEPSAVTLGILVKTYGRSGFLDRAVAVWNEMLPQRKQANAVTYGCMLDACVKCGDLKKAFELFEDVKKEGKHRNTVLYTTLIKGCSAHKNLQSALALFREMREEAVPYNTFTYNSMIDVCINSGALQMAERIFGQMITEESQIQGACSPDLITYSTLLKGYCQTSELDKAFMVIEAIRERGLPCDELVYNTLIDGCVKIRDLSTGVGFFAEMIRDGATPSPITHSIMIKLYRNAGYGQQSAEAVAMLYQHYGLQAPLVGSRKRGSGRKNKAQGASPHSMLIPTSTNHTSVQHFSSASSESSSTSSGLQTPVPVPFPYNQMATMNYTDFGMSGVAMQAAEPGPINTMVDCLAQGSWPMDVQSMLQSVPESMPNGQVLIMGPYPVPQNNICATVPANEVYAPAPADYVRSKPSTKAIIKI